MAANVGSPPFDPELTPALAISPFPKPLTDEHIPKIREFAESISGFRESEYPTVTHEEFRFSGPDNNELTISLFRPKGLPLSPPAPCIYFMHGGGFYHGTRFNGAALPIEWAKLFNGIVVSIEYRAAPENRAPALVEDCYAGLLYVAANAASLGIDAARIMVFGFSSGATLALGVSMLARDRAGPSLAAQLLMYPALDDRCDLLSYKQYPSEGIYDTQQTIHAFECLLGSKRGGTDEEVSIYSVPGRATQEQLKGLPPMFLEVGSAEPFRDSIMALATKVWATGGRAELHVWEGAFHAFNMFMPDAKVSQGSAASKINWIERIMVLKKD